MHAGCKLKEVSSLTQTPQRYSSLCRKLMQARQKYRYIVSKGKGHHPNMHIRNLLQITILDSKWYHIQYLVIYVTHRQQVMK